MSVIACGSTKFALPQNTPSKYTCADLFAGAGGLAVGFHAAGFRCIFFNEIESTAASTFKMNFPLAEAFVCPIEELTAKDIQNRCDIDLETLDIVIGGPPCQGFSINAPIRSEDDPRNHLFQHYVRLVLEGLKPKFILMENVPGLVSLDQGRTLKSVKAAFEQAGYRVIYRILNAAHYGVPQERWRLFFLGTRLPGFPLSFPLPSHFSIRKPNFTGGRDLTFAHAIGRPKERLLFDEPLAPPTSVVDAIGDLPPLGNGGGDSEMAYTSPPKTAYQIAMREGSSKLYNHVCHRLMPINLKRLRYVRPGGSWRDIPFELLPAGLKRARRSDHTRRYGRLHPNEPSGTVMTKCDPHWGSFFHYEQDRIITIREAARLQSFPDWFKFEGSLAEQYKQVGNAVPPLLAKAIACHIRVILEKTKYHR